ncbi:MAG TPA: bacillithiol biosynthesis BshC, partial [Fibrobacteria bacterium]|nr:bacillithiol biosynthesis BshC [Fibrobacteria bacterium]
SWPQIASVGMTEEQAQQNPHGMLFLAGHSPAVRAAARPVLEKAIRGWRDFQAGLERGTQALAAVGIEPPVSLRPGAAHAFALMDGERKRLFLEAAASGDRLYLPDHPGEDLLPRLPGLALTHDVFSRLLVAESALPVLGHVLGPAELRYFAQMAPVFLAETGDMPLVHPRMSLAALPEPAARALADAGFSLREAAALKPSTLRERLRERVWRAHPASADLPAAPPEEWLAPVRAAHARHFQDTGPLNRLERALAGSWRRYLRALERAAYSRDTGSGGEEAPLFRALRWLGNGLGQDRHLNLYSLVDALGREGVEAMLAAAAPAEPGLRIFTYGGSGE